MLRSIGNLSPAGKFGLVAGAAVVGYLAYSYFKPSTAKASTLPDGIIRPKALLSSYGDDVTRTSGGKLTTMGTQHILNRFYEWKHIKKVLKEDNKMGPETIEAVKEFQKYTNEVDLFLRHAESLVSSIDLLPVNGVVGPSTADRLATWWLDDLIYRDY